MKVYAFAPDHRARFPNRFYRDLTSDGVQLEDAQSIPPGAK